MRIEPLTFYENVSVISFFICSFYFGFVVKDLRYDENEHLVIIILYFIVFFIIGYVVRGKI